MNGFLDSVFNTAVDIRDFIASNISPALPWLELVGFLASVALLIGIAYVTIKSGWLAWRIEEWGDALRVGDLFNRRTLRAWSDILKKLHIGDDDSIRSAVIEADRMLGNVLRVMGYRGETVGERLAAVTSDVLPNVEALRSAHKVRTRLEHDSSYAITQADAIALMRAYADAFRRLGLID